MAKGSILKEEIIKKILEVFPGSFLYNSGKEIRIPGQEGADLLQIKVTLTCAKTNVENVGTTTPTEQQPQSETPASSSKFMAEPTEEEKENVKELCQRLGLL